MAAVSEPVSPPPAKRARVDPDTQFSTLPPSPSTNGHGHSEAANGSSSSGAPPVATSTPFADPSSSSSQSKKNPDYESEDDDEEEVPEQPVAEVEDHSRRDMYLDTVSLYHPLERQKRIRR